MNLNILSTTSNRIILLVSIFLGVFANFTFFKNTLEIYPIKDGNGPFLLSLLIVIICINVLILSLTGIRQLLKPTLILLLLVAASSAYFIDGYGIIVDTGMLENALATDMREASDLISFKLVGYLVFIFLLPTIIITKLKIRVDSFKKSVLSRLTMLIISIAVLASCMMLFSKHYTSFIREHKVLRTYIAPAYPLYSSIKYLSSNLHSRNQQKQTLGKDAEIPVYDIHREIIVLVIGEAARADHFSLNGYARKTNPLLEFEDVVSYKNVWSCGTSTAVSLPCMFSTLNRNNYSKTKANQTENVLDVLSHADVNIHWLDNNSSSKGVFNKLEEEDFRSSPNNPICDPECRDVGMLARLENAIDSHTSGDVLIVLHQMGSHGPAYYKRYPKEFERFTPVCETNQLEQCSEAEITNAYDNSILYTDYLLSEVIQLLKRKYAYAETGLVYISDHGESLGENNLYLHGLPYIFAPDSQKRVPMIMWFNSNILATDVNYDSLFQRQDNKYTHDNLFHTFLGLFEINSSVYSPEMDIIDHQFDQ